MRCPVCKSSRIKRPEELNRTFWQEYPGYTVYVRHCKDCFTKIRTMEVWFGKLHDKSKKIEIGRILGEICEAEMENSYSNIIKIFNYLKEQGFKVRSYDEISERTSTHHYTVVKVCELLHKLGIVPDPISDSKKLKLQGKHNPRNASGKFKIISPKAIKPLKREDKERIEYFEKFGVKKITV